MRARIVREYMSQTISPPTPKTRLRYPPEVIAILMVFGLHNIAKTKEQQVSPLSQVDFWKRAVPEHCSQHKEQIKRRDAKVQRVGM